MRWEEKAACRGVPDATQIFFPDIPTGDIRDFYWVTARKICGSCPVTAECLAFVLPFEKATGRRDGMWGGLTPRERDQREKQPVVIRLKKK